MSSLSDMSMSLFGNKLQIWGNSSGIDTQSLIEVELAMLEMRNYPLESQKKYFTQEKTQWENFRTTMDTFKQSVEALKKISDASKGVALSQDGFVSVNATNKALNLNYAIEVKQVATSHKLLSDAQGDPTVALGKNATVTINGKELEVTEDMSLNDFAKKVNDGGFGVNASIISGTLVLTAKETGQANQISLGDSTFFQEIGLLKSDGGIKNEIQTAKDAIVTVDGVEVTSASNTISGAVDGITINVLRETTTPVSMTVKQDETVLKEAVEKFVSSYNKTIMAINQYTSEGATLQGKTIITQAKSMLNRALTSATDSNLMLYQVGIELDGVTRDGTIKFDEAKLQAQLKDDYQGVFDLFVGGKGMGTQLFEKVEELTKDDGSIFNKIEGLNKSIKGIDDTLDRYAASFERQQAMILTKYAKFESMMATLNLQQQFMSAQLDALNSKKD